MMREQKLMNNSLANDTIESYPYQAWDNNGKFHKDYTAKISIARTMGYTYVSEAICKLYILNAYSLNDIGELFDMRPTAIYYRLKNWGIPRRKRGGGMQFNKTFLVVGALMDLKKNWTGGVHDLYREASKLYGLSFHTVKNFYVKDLWKDVKNEKRNQR